mmetsp:Transcript_10406/g.15969  ORF Transcript_10406/g.15969 Transcript_10406/m.15969 type:complete len:195 (+) Transcript_10406:40-624(+)|eukprot:CAMPEP_0195297554 /NCGR_PEP_ID=MMETSP0707-20130614/21748_1 /TAXON_ID=33640 /ORGANISM="Asterionellopsis glacialis, Strain CCMP134" /LENGTH=194 /DNA_ID=CAMNT_0040359399 /DNA_START=39 /DNA_END=623 /DNA_ORIENTATION=+
MTHQEQHSANNTNNPAEALDFTGRWTREPSLCTGLLAALEARGCDKEAASKKSVGPYVQEWRKTQADGSDLAAAGTTTTTFCWSVTTYNTEMSRPWRQVIYPTSGEFQETYKGDSVIFGPSDPQGSVLKRHVEYQPCPESDVGSAYIIVTRNPHGGATEISRRYLSSGRLVLERTFRSDDSNEGTVSVEVFERA